MTTISSTWVREPTKLSGNRTGKSNSRAGTSLDKEITRLRLFTEKNNEALTFSGKDMYNCHKPFTKNTLAGSLIYKVK